MTRLVHWKIDGLSLRKIFDDTSLALDPASLGMQQDCLCFVSPREILNSEGFTPSETLTNKNAFHFYSTKVISSTRCPAPANLSMINKQ